LSKYFSRMLNVDPKRRPTASQLIKCPVFTSEGIKLLISLGELAALKPAAENLACLSQITERVGTLPVSICIHKILPSLARTLQMACTDFSNRDSREACRQSIQLCLNLLSQIVEHNKIDEEHYTKECMTSVLILWTMSDRTVRTALLGSLKTLNTITPTGTVNKSIFDPLLAGFADSNSKMREETLKCLVYVVDKLDEKNLQEKLVRCIGNLSNDTENSIRTNATIFLGRIALKLKEGVRQRVLCTSFSKAMKDNFIHCRVAGLKAATACLPMLDLGQLTSKILPQVSTLLLDRHSEVRHLALRLMELSMIVMKEHHVALSLNEKKERTSAALVNAGNTPVKSSHQDADSVSTGSTFQSVGSSWASSWATLSTSIEKVTLLSGEVVDSDKVNNSVPITERVAAVNGNSLNGSNGSANVKGIEKKYFR